MSTNEILVYVLLVIVVLAFFREWAPPDIVAIGAMCFLIITKVLSVDDVLAVFSHPAPITIASMFIMSAGLERTGCIDVMGKLFLKAAGKTELRVLLVLMLLGAVLSAFINNTPVVVVFLPIVLSLARSTDLKSSRLLIPLSFASILGGTCTLTGTSTNLVIDGQAQELGLEPFTMFELTPLGLVYAAIGFTYMLTIGRKLLPSRESPGMNTIEAKKRHFLTQVMIQEESPLIGKTLTETLMKTFPEARILEIRRRGVVQTTPLNELMLEASDRIRLTVHGASFEDFKESGGVAFTAGKEFKLSELENETLKLMEGIVGPRSRLDGKTLKELNFRQRFGVIILAVHRKGVDLRKKMEDVRLRSGDTLIVEGRVDSINRLQEEMDFVSITEPPKREVRPGKGKIAALITIAFIMGATFKTYPIAMLAILAAGLLLLTRCLEPREAYRSVQWNIIFLLFGMLALGKAMETSGGAETIATMVEQVFGNSGPVVILAVIYLLSSILTELISNTAVAALITPIVIKIAANIDVDPRPFVVAIMFGCSASFATPIGYQTNTYVYGAGGYKFTDFPKVGVPLNLILWIVATLLIPIFWPFKKEATPAAVTPAAIIAPAQ